MPTSASSHDMSECYELWEEASRDGIDTMDKIFLIDMDCSKFLSSDNTRWVDSKPQQPSSSSHTPASNSNPMIWCATAKDVTRQDRVSCLSKAGGWFVTKADAQREHDRLKDKDIFVWCANKDWARYTRKSICTEAGGTTFGSEYLAKAEHERLNPPKVVKLTIRSNVRGDRVYIDGKYEGTTRLKRDLPKGRHTVRIEKGGYKTYEEEIDLKTDLALTAFLEKIAEKPTDSTSAEVVFWKSIQGSKDPAEYRAYLESFPKGKFAPLAKLKIKKLGGGSVAKPSVPSLDYGRYYALVIGNDNYRHMGDLRTAVNDARRVSAVLEDDYGFEVKLLRNASRDDVIKSLSGLRRKVRSEDNLLIYYAGHGYLDEGANEGYWLPTDAEREDPSNWIPNDTIVAQVRAMDAKHVMVVADSCFSGTITRGLKIEQRTPDWLQKIVKKKARTALTSGGLEPVMDSGGGKHSAFASAFISLLEENDGVLDASQLFSQLRPKVMVNSPQTPEYGNIHQAGHDGGDFLFVRK